MEIFNFGPKNFEFFPREKRGGKRQNGLKSIFLEVEELSNAKKVTLPPIFGVEEHEKPTLEPRKHHFSGEKADFWPKEGLYSCPWQEPARPRL